MIARSEYVAIVSRKLTLCPDVAELSVHAKVVMPVATGVPDIDVMPAFQLNPFALVTVGELTAVSAGPVKDRVYEKGTPTKAAADVAELTVI